MMNLFVDTWYANSRKDFILIIDQLFQISSLIIRNYSKPSIYMLSYRHAFHAGNHADVLKHFVFSLVLQYFNQKDKPYWVIDSHAGAGMFALQEAFAQKNAEFSNGIAKLIAAKNLTAELKTYRQMIQSFNAENSLNFYPGSPKIAEYYARADDKLRLFELHPHDFSLLSANFSQQAKQTKVAQQDGFDGA